MSRRPTEVLEVRSANRLPALTGVLVGTLMCLVAMLAATLRMAPTVIGGYHDDGIYVANAKALAEGQGYRSINLPGAPYQTKYPPIYPALLAIVWKIWPSFPENAAAVKWVSVVATGSAAMLMSLYLIRWNYASPGLVVAAGLLAWTSPFTAYFGSQALSEMPFAVSLALALWSAELAAVGTRQRTGLFAIGCLAGMPVLIRVIGVAAGVAAVVSVGLVARRAAFAVLAGVSLVAGTWITWSMSFADSSNPVAVYYSDYLTWWLATVSDIGRVVFVNLVLLVRSLEFFGFALVAERVGALFLLALSGAIAWSIAAGVLGRRVLAMFLALYLAIVLVWPWPPARFLVPVAHPLLVFALRPLWLPAHRGIRLAGFATVAALLVFNVLSLRTHAALTHTDGYAYITVPEPSQRLRWTDYEKLFEWIRQNASPDAVLVSGMDSMLYLYTNRTGFRPFSRNIAASIYAGEEPSVGTQQELWTAIESGRATHVIVSPMSGFLEESSYTSVVEQLRLRYGDRLTLVYTGRDPRFQVFYVVPAVLGQRTVN